MGVITKIILTPVVIAAPFVSHVAYQVFRRSGIPNEALPWPSETDRASAIASRQVLLDDFKKCLDGNEAGFITKYGTPNISWEDPTAKYDGFEAVDGIIRAVTPAIDSTKIELHDEIHNPSEIIMDWTLTTTLKKPLKISVSLLMRTHLSLQDTKEGEIKVSRVMEAWNRNPLLSEDTVKPAFYGKVHSGIRRFNGSMICRLVKLF